MKLDDGFIIKKDVNVLAFDVSSESYKSKVKCVLPRRKNGIVFIQNGKRYDIISEFPQRHLDEDELGRCIGEYMVVDKNARVALLCLKKHLERKIAEARVADNPAAVDSMLEVLKATIQAAAVANKHTDL